MGTEAMKRRRLDCTTTPTTKMGLCAPTASCIFVPDESLGKQRVVIRLRVTVGRPELSEYLPHALNSGRG